MADKKRQTAVDWLASQITSVIWEDPYWQGKLKIAKTMEKVQILDARYSCEYKGVFYALEFETSEEYYNRIYNTNEE